MQPYHKIINPVLQCETYTCTHQLQLCSKSIYGLTHLVKELNFYSPASIKIQNELLNLSFGVGIFLSELLKEVPI